VEPRLSRGYRLYYIMALVGPIAGLPGAVCGVLVDAEHRWLWALMLLAFVVFAGWIVYILRRGAEPLRIMQGMSKAFAGIGALVAGLLIFYGLQNPSVVSVLWALFGVLVFLLTSFINLWNRVIAAERTMREHILRVEYRLADLNRPPR
jgi:4-amino-4-deoxy-L-arabinose transferase-like glycosyltransferase